MLESIDQTAAWGFIVTLQPAYISQGVGLIRGFCTADPRKNYSPLGALPWLTEGDDDGIGNV